MAVLRNGGPLLRKLRRMLLLQELLRRGVLSYKGLFLPSAAHGERELEETVTRFREALIAVLAAGNGPEVVQRLEISPASELC